MNLGKEAREAEIPADLLRWKRKNAANHGRAIAELDDDLTVKFLEGEEISVDELKAALRKAVIAARPTRSFAAVPCGIKVSSRCWML